MQKPLILFILLLLIHTPATYSYSCHPTDNQLKVLSGILRALSDCNDPTFVRSSTAFLRTARVKAAVGVLNVLLWFQVRLYVTANIDWCWRIFIIREGCLRERSRLNHALDAFSCNPTIPFTPFTSLPKSVTPPYHSLLLTSLPISGSQWMLAATVCWPQAVLWE